MSQLFFLIPTAIIGGFLFWAWRRLVIVPAWGRRWLSIGLAVTFVAMLAAVFAGFDAWGSQLSPATMRPLVWAGMVFLPFCLYLFLGLTLGYLGSVLLWLVRWRDDHGAAARLRWNRLVAVVVSATAAAVTAYGVIEAGQPRVSERTVTSADLPAELDGLRIALLTDLHAGAVRSDSFTREVVAEINAAQPDLVVIAGDIVDGTAERYSPEIASLADLEAPLGVFATTGNHEMFRDTANWLTAFEQVGLTMLNNSSTKIRRNGATITLAGVHDYSGTGPFSPDPEAALAGTSPGDFILYIAHQPRQALSVAGRGIDLQLSGHTHGGQMWPIRYLVPLQQPMVDGYAVLGDVPTVTSRGAGAWGPPVRVAASPEIPVITVRRG